MKLLFCNLPITLYPQYTIKNSLQWMEISLGHIITAKLGEQREISIYAYIYAFQHLYRHIAKSHRLRTKLQKADSYLKTCVYYKMMKKESMDSFINGYFDIEAFSFYLWKRDMEYGEYNNSDYQFNPMTPFAYKFHPVYSIINYLERIERICKRYMDENFTFSILVHIANDLFMAKYREWQRLMNYLVLNYDKYEIFERLSNISIRDLSSDYIKDYLLSFQPDKHICKLYF